MFNYKDNEGRFRTKGLFLETSSVDYRKRYDVPFTLKEHDYEFKGKTYVALRKVFLECEDPTEYVFAMQVFNSWEHWKKLRTQPFFKEHYASWKEELELRIQSKGVRLIALEAASGGKSSASSAKWLAERGWIGKQDKGRPSKAKIQQAAQHYNSANAELDELLDDAQRINH